MALQNWKAEFIRSLVETPNVSRAARAADVDRSHAYDEKRADPEFARAWEDALAGAVDDLEGAAFARARLESDTLMIFLLKCHRRETYGERAAGLSTAEVVAAFGEAAGSLDDESRDRLIAIFSEKLDGPR